MGAHYHWPFRRLARPFVVRVVEPRDYKPTEHATLFNAVMTELLDLTGGRVDAYDQMKPLGDRWDLITFPEAFVPSKTLLDVLTALPSFGPLGCVHVGLRPDDGTNHLFTVAQIEKLAADLSNSSNKRSDDLAAFKDWLATQDRSRRFNIGCLFMVDADGEVRVCLHPKIVRSQFEENPLPERNMDEGNLLSIITLLPSDAKFPTITLQPILCSDALSLETDRGLGGPLLALNRYSHCFERLIPDHVDIVSVAACTPQVGPQNFDSIGRREWHGKFQSAFLGLAENPDYSRHHFAAVVLSNFQEIEKSSGGLSGIFLPVEPRYNKFPDGIDVACWGRPKSDGNVNNRWSLANEMPLRDWQNRGFIAGLGPSDNVLDLVRIFDCTVHRLPRENSLWSKNPSLTSCQVTIGKRDPAGTIIFERVP